MVDGSAKRTVSTRGRLGTRGPTIMSFEHTPVMVDEIVSLFDSVPGGVIVDATLGGGGHSTALLEAHDAVSILGIDRDDDALQKADQRLASYGDRVTTRKSRFDKIGEKLEKLGCEEISGFLFDLGVSSYQIDAAERGFSYRFDGPLDMRMDRSGGRTAGEVVNRSDMADLVDLLRYYGDERHAVRVARAIIANRPMTTTSELAQVVRDAIPASDKRRGDPAKRTFQALRIEVNDELRILRRSIDDVIDRLSVGGRGAVLAYHSGEDRIVKDAFRDRVDVDDHKSPVPISNPEYALLWSGSKKPSKSEVERNPRASSARLRAIERSRPPA